MKVLNNITLGITLNDFFFSTMFLFLTITRSFSQLITWFRVLKTFLKFCFELNGVPFTENKIISTVFS